MWYRMVPLGWVCLLGLVATTRATNQPNIILIVADDLGFADTGFRGSTQIPTPNLDTLAYDGVILDNYYVQPICTPSRAALLTGKYPIHTGMQHEVIGGGQPYGVGLNETFLSQLLNQVNYSTHLVGKWHLGFFAKEYTPTFRGFESHFGFYNGKEDYWDHSFVERAINNETQTWGLDLWDQLDVRRDLFGNYSTYLFRDRAQNIIRQHDKRKPLFLTVTFNAVHVGNSYNPLEAPYEYVRRMSHIADPNRRKYAAMLSALDDAVGNITVTLHEAGLLSNSLIVFTTDNGGPAGGYDLNHACNWPLRGMKYLLWEGGTRGAAFVWSPLLKKSGYVSNHMMHITDWLPTLSYLAGYPMKSLPGNLDGFNLWHVISGNVTSPRSEILLNIDPVSGREALRKGDYKLIHGNYEAGSWGGWFMPSGMTAQQKHVRTRHMPLAGNETVNEWHMPMDMIHNPYDTPENDKTQEKNVYKSNTVTKYSVENSKGIGAMQQTLSPELVKILQDLGRKTPVIHPVTLDCGTAKYVPCNASTELCLYNVKDDPCELQNLASEKQEVLEDLKQTLERYRKSMIPIRNKPEDARSWPMHHGGVWKPWINLTQENWHMHS